MCSGSRKILGEAASAPVAPALRRRNLRRDRSFFMVHSSEELASGQFRVQTRSETKDQLLASSLFELRA
jgi:hypothetical protein